MLEALLEQINHHLEQNSIIVSLGSINIIDVSVIEAKQSRKRKGRSGNNTQDPEADYNVKIATDGKRKTTYGYKMHANTDEDGFVKKMTYTPGNVHDSKEFDKLLGINKCQVSPRYPLLSKTTLRNISGFLINKSGFKLYQYSKAS